MSLVIPAIAGVIRLVLAQRAGALLTPGKQTQLIEEVTAELEANEVFKNETNTEPLWRSRTMIAATTAFLGGVFLVHDQFLEHGLNLLEWSSDPSSIAAYAMVWAGAYGMWGRAWKGLRPAFAWLGDLKRKLKGDA